MNRLFKATIVLFALIFSATAFAGCAQVAPTTLSSSYFLQNTANLGIGNVNETVNYDVTLTQTSAQRGSGVSIDLKKGSYQTILTSTYEPATGTPCYKLETLLMTQIEYTLGETEMPISNDIVSTTTYFLGVKDGLKVLSSQRYAQVSTPVKTAEGYKISRYNYSVITTYQGNSATVKFTTLNGDFEQPSSTKVYKDLDKTDYYFDSELMLFVGRAINFTDTSSLLFSSIDALSGTVREMKLASNTTTPTAEIKFQSEAIPHAYMVNGSAMEIGEGEQTQQNLPCRVVSFAINGTFTGSPINCWYTSPTVEKGYSRLIKIEQSAPYGLGTFTYIIKDATYSG